MNILKKSRKIVYINNYQQEYEPPEEEKETKEEIKISLENTLQEPDDNSDEDQTQEEPISLDNFIQKTKENGTFEFGMYKYEFFIEDKQYIIYCNNDNMMIEIYYGDIIEEVQIYLNVNKYEYMKLVNYEVSESHNGDIEETNFINNLIKEVYEYM